MKINAPVGYLIKGTEGLYGERGVCYDYVLSSQGVWVEAEGPGFAARVLAAEGNIRGLAPSEFSLVLRHGLIPHGLFDLALNIFLSDIKREWYTAITWDNGYHIVQPAQTRSGARVVFDNPEKVILDLHSHNVMPPFFSGTDDDDEQGLRLYGVVGRLNKEPEMALRVGVYGHFADIAWEDVFDSSPTSVKIVSGEGWVDEVEETENDHIGAQKGHRIPTSLREELGPDTYIQLPTPNREPTIGPQPKSWWHWPFGRKTLPSNVNRHPGFRTENKSCHTE